MAEVDAVEVPDREDRTRRAARRSTRFLRWCAMLDSGGANPLAPLPRELPAPLLHDPGRLDARDRDRRDAAQVRRGRREPHRGGRRVHTSCCGSPASTCATASPSPRSPRPSCASGGPPARARSSRSKPAASPRAGSSRPVVLASLLLSLRRARCVERDARPVGRAQRVNDAARRRTASRSAAARSGTTGATSSTTSTTPTATRHTLHGVERLPTERRGAAWSRASTRPTSSVEDERLGADRRAAALLRPATVRRRPRAPSASRRRSSTSAAHATSPCSTPASTRLSIPRAARVHRRCATADGRDAGRCARPPAPAARRTRSR